MDHLRINDQSGGNIQIDAQDSVYREESFRYGNTLVRRVIERSLEPLLGSGHCRIQSGRDHIT